MPLSAPTVLGEFQTAHAGAVAFGTGPFDNSITTVDDSIILVFLYCTQEGTNTGAWDSDLLASGGGLTYVQEANVRAVSGSNIGGIKVFSALVDTGATFTLTIDDGANSAYTYKVVVVSFTGHDVADAIGQVITGSENPMSGAFSMTLPGSPALTSYVVAMTGFFSDNMNVTPGATFTELSEPAHVTNSFAEIEVEYRTNSTSTTVDWTDVTSTFGGDGHGAAVEVKAAPVSIPVMYHHYRTMKAA